MKKKEKRVIAATLGTAAILTWLTLNPNSYETVLTEPSSDKKSSQETPTETDSSATSSSEIPSEENLAVESSLEPLGESASNVPLASAVLDALKVKGRASKTGYARTQFYNSWPTIDGCSLRQRIIKRELGASAVLDSSDNCTVISGEFTEPYTGSHMIFYQKSDFSSGIQIDHVVALSDAWQKGAQSLSTDDRYRLATDPLNLLAVDSKTNQGKSDGDAATWLPPNKSFRCAYVARQVSVKYKYNLWVTSAEKSAISAVLKTCPNEPAVGVTL